MRRRISVRSGIAIDGGRAEAGVVAAVAGVALFPPVEVVSTSRAEEKGVVVGMGVAPKPMRI